MKAAVVKMLIKNLTTTIGLLLETVSNTKLFSLQPKAEGKQTAA